MSTTKNYALQEQGASDTKRKYHTNIFTHSFNLVKKYCNRISLLCSSYIQKHRENGAKPHHFQRISDPDGEQVHVTLEESVLSIVDKRGGTAQLSAYLVPELRATLLDVEKEFGRRFIS